MSFVGCAKRGSISGGLKDTIPPVLTMSFPKNFSTEFSSKSIKLTFDEFVKLKNVNKQLIISPPLSKTPQILPTTASKSITINFLDSLRTNTTYSLNFGKSIEDNNEGNPYPQFKYVFSTGKYIDSLSIKGTVKDALDKKPSSITTVMLYEMTETRKDSAVYNQNPSYIAFSLEQDASFKIDNIKAGKYFLVAVDDKSSNYRFEPKTEKIGFRKTAITIPNDSLFEIKLFKEVPKLKTFKPSQSSGCSAVIGFEGDAKDAKLTLKRGEEMLSSIITKVPKKDSLQIWFKPFKLEKSAVDSLQLSIVKDSYTKDFTFKIKAQKQDSLTISAISSKILPLNEKFLLRTNLPISRIDESKISLIKKDSTSVPFKVEYDELNLTLKVNFQKDPLEKYSLKFLPESVVDFTGQSTKKLLKFDLETKNISDYGNLRLNLENVKQFPVIIELTDKNGEVKYFDYSESSTQIDFNLIEPALYALRLIYDENKNKIWDSGNYLDKKQPENVIYFPKDIDVRANWDVQQTFILKE
ncbi:MAG: Ig-like domain-containing protein [Flavobacterium sp.]|nr:Ig-like domain-containing protein [Flavobacterium sp.]